jgi:hypothetical protein
LTFAPLRVAFLAAMKVSFIGSRAEGAVGKKREAFLTLIVMMRKH